MTYNAATGELIGTWTSERKLIFAGGWMTRAQIADDGTIIMGSDVDGPWYLPPGATEWIKCFRPGDNYNLSPDEYLGDDGTWDVAICATDSNTMGWIQGGYLFRTTDRCATVTRTALPRITSGVEPNDGALRCIGNMLVFDPINGQHIIVGLPTGLKRSTDGGANWTSISTATVPTPSTAGGVLRRYCLAADRSSAAVSGRTGRWRVFSVGSGLHTSTDGGASWGAAASGTSTFKPAHIKINDATGRIHLSGFSDAVEGEYGTSQYRYSDNATTWTAPSGVDGKALVISSQNNAHHYLVTGGGDYWFSSDSGANWGPRTGTLFNAVQAKYINATDAGGFKSNGTALFSPISNRLWMFEGVGAWYVDSPPTNNSVITWTDVTANAENMIVSFIHISADGTRRIGVHDKCGLVLSRDQIGKSSATRTSVTGLFCHGTNIAEAPGNPNYLVQGNFWDDNRNEGLRRRGGWSSDRGKTWHPFASDIADVLGGCGGNIISLSETVHIQLMTSNAGIGWTKDNGATWAKLVIGDDIVYRCHATYRINHMVLVADPFNSNQALLYICDDNQLQDGLPYTLQDLANVRGVYRITYNPTTQQMSTTRLRPTWIINNTDYNHGHLMPFAANDWLWLAQDGSGGGLWRSKNGGVDWASMKFWGDGYSNAAFGTVFSVAVGKPVVAGGPNALLIFGWRDPARASNGDYSSWGAWLCLNADAAQPTLKRIMQWPGQSHTVQRAVAAGDPGVFGSYDIGGSGGAVNIKFSDKRRGR